MVRVDGNCWIKTAMEYELNEPPKLSVVVTGAGYSDWSMQESGPARNLLWLRVSRKSSDFTVEHSENGRTWKMLRVAHLPVSDESTVGFIEPPISNWTEIHNGFFVRTRGRSDKGQDRGSAGDRARE